MATPEQDPRGQEAIAVRIAHPEMSMAKIGSQIGVTRERVRQVLEKANLPTRAVRPEPPPPQPGRLPRTRQGRVVTLSDISSDMIDWVWEEVDRRKNLGLPGAYFYVVFIDGLRIIRAAQASAERTFTLDGHGPYYSTLECLDAMGVPDEERGKYWYRWDRLPQEYQARIQVRDGRIGLEQDPEVGEPVEALS